MSSFDFFESQMLITVILAIIFAVLIGVTIMVFYLLNLQNALKQVGESRRLVPPSNVWLMFIPLFNLIYAFILYPRISDSIKAEYEYRGLEPEGDFGRAIGITIPILGLCSLIPILGFAHIGTLVLFIIFWVKISGYKTKLQNTPLDGGVFEGNKDLLDN